MRESIWSSERTLIIAPQQVLFGNKRKIKPKGQSRDTGNIGHIKYRTKTNKTTAQHKTMSNTDPAKNWKWTQVLAKDKYFLLL
jgi:hypothetical protein